MNFWGKEKEMKITNEILAQYSAPGNLVSYLKDKKLINLEIVELLKKINPKIKPEFVFWCNDFLPLSDEEQQIIDKLISIKDSNYCYHSYNVTNSERVSISNNITSSYNVYNCSNISECSDINNSSNCTFAQKIYDSKYCNNTNFAAQSSNCNNCFNIFNSKFCVESESLIDCSNIMRSKNLRECNNCKDSFFSAKCENLNHSFFCYNTSGDYLIFNQPYDKEFYDFIKQQLMIEMRPLAIFSPNQIDYNVNKFTMYFYLDQPQEFWEMIKSFPNYDDNILFKITENLDILRNKDRSLLV